jgi:vesicle coat complex subunit
VKISDIELTKFADLYFVADSSHEPEQAKMAVSTLVQYSQDPNPFVRALAIRNMCRVLLESVAEHIVTPLTRCLRDSDPCVRKTVAFGVLKFMK